MLDLKAVFGYPDEMPETEATAEASDVTLTEGPDVTGFDFSGWVRRADCKGRWGWEPPDLSEADRWWAEYDFGELPEADWTCPQCGGLLWWEDLVGGKHCLQCEADKAERADRLAAKAAGLLRRNPRPTERPDDRKGRLTAHNGPRCEETGLADPEHVSGNRPTGGDLGALAGCEVGQEARASGDR